MVSKIAHALACLFILCPLVATPFLNVDFDAAPSSVTQAGFESWNIGAGNIGAKTLERKFDVATTNVSSGKITVQVESNVGNLFGETRMGNPGYGSGFQYTAFYQDRVSASGAGSVLTLTFTGLDANTDYDVSLYAKAAHLYSKTEVINTTKEASPFAVIVAGRSQHKYDANTALQVAGATKRATSNDAGRLQFTLSTVLWDYDKEGWGKSISPFLNGFQLGPAAAAPSNPPPVEMARSNEPRPVWAVRDWQGMPAFWKDQTPVTPMMFWQWKPEDYEIVNFSKAGVELFSFFGSTQHYRRPYWKQDGTIEPAFQDEQIRKLLKLNPEALFIPRIFTTPPNWWVKENPDEVLKYSVSDERTTKRGPRISFASEKYMREGGEAFRKTVRKLMDADYGKNMIGIHITEGPSGEWFHWDSQFSRTANPVASDISEPMRQRFIRYLRDKYENKTERLRDAWKTPSLTFETVQVPDLTQRRQTNAGAWRDPQKSRAVMDYFECHNLVTVELIEHYCRIIKEESNNNLLTMAFYGYTQDVNWPIEIDHRGIAAMLRSKNLDILSAPHTYYRRRLGEDGGMRQYLGSAALHGKLFFDEGDDQPHLEKLKPKPDPRCSVNTMEESQALLYREFGNTVTHGAGLWYMDLRGGWFQDPILVDTVGRMKKWSDVAMKHSRRRNAQVAVISAPESEFYLGYRQSPNNEISYGLYHNQMAALYRTGVPFDWYLIDDLEAIRDKDYKVYIFLDCFYMTEQQRKAAEALRSDGRTLVWFYAPGYASQTDLSLTRMENLTGFRFETAEQGMLSGVMADSGREIGIKKSQKTLFTVRPEKSVMALAHGINELKGKAVVAIKKQTNWTSVFSAIPGVTSDQFRTWFRDAGVHVYTDCEDVLSVNESWLMLHTQTDGIKQITLPQKSKKITEITTEKVIGENIDRFSIDLPKRSTAVFLME